MREDLLKTLTAEIEGQVERLFEDERLRAVAAGEKFGRAPHTDESFPIECGWLFRIKRQVCRALLARESFRETAPPWAPELPLSSADIEKAIRSKDNRIVLVGYYARSWACANWGANPSFYDYACGAMACEHAPKHVRDDLQLLQEFPPKPLEGLDRNLCWGTFDRIFDFAQQLTKNEEIWRRRGMVNDAKWARGILRLIRGGQRDPAVRDFLDSQ